MLLRSKYSECPLILLLSFLAWERGHLGRSLSLLRAGSPHSYNCCLAVMSRSRVLPVSQKKTADSRLVLTATPSRE